MHGAQRDPSLSPGAGATFGPLPQMVAEQAPAPPLPRPASEAGRSYGRTRSIRARFCASFAVAFPTNRDWLRLGQRLLANASPCVDYWISIPPLAADKTAPRCLQDDLVRALGPRVHVMAELHFAGWNKWWTSVAGRTPAQAGAEFVRTWRDCGYLQPGETWALNEMHSGVRRNVPGARENMIKFLDAVRAASGVEGVAWIIGVGQQTTNVSDYKARSQEWLQDAHFWDAMNGDLDVWGQ